MSRYPEEPGYKEHETSREAADAIAPVAGLQRKRAYEYICGHPDRTADEVAQALGESVLTIRPRVSELRIKGLIIANGRGLNRSGRPAHRWRATRCI